MRVLRRIFSRLYVYILWCFLAFLAVGLLFSRIDDTDAARKVTLFADVPAVEDAALASYLEEVMPEGIRMIKVHPFSYAMFDSDNLLSADLYIVPASHVEDYAGSFRSIAGAVTGRRFSDALDSSREITTDAVGEILRYNSMIASARAMGSWRTSLRE